MPEFDIDNFKETWQKQNVKPKYDSTEILQMLNKKSRNYVKYILWISIVEFLLVLSISVYYLFKGDEGAELLHIVERMGITKTPALEKSLDLFYTIMRIVSFSITGYFIVRFFISYKKIKVECNLKNLILQIIRFKNTVNLFIITNILMLVLITAFLSFFMFRIISDQNVELQQSTFIGFVVGLVVSLAFSIFLIWIYYRIVYGIIMKRLGKNLAQLKEIDLNATEQ